MYTNSRNKLEQTFAVWDGFQSAYTSHGNKPHQHNSKFELAFWLSATRDLDTKAASNTSVAAVSISTCAAVLTANPFSLPCGIHSTPLWENCFVGSHVARGSNFIVYVASAQPRTNCSFASSPSTTQLSMSLYVTCFSSFQIK